MMSTDTDGNNELSIKDSLNHTKLLPTYNPNTTNTSITLPYTRSPSSLILGPNHHLDKASELQNSREFNEQQSMGSSSTSRWNPKPEQLLALEEMYRLGMRTPTAEQIHQIATKLRRFGKIEGKNVFYWFQNHKARERQKRRREVETSKKVQRHDIEILDKKESGLRRVVHELEQTKGLVPPSNCCKHLEGFVSMHRAATAEERGTVLHGWSKYEEIRELQQKINSLEKHATWQTMDFSSSLPINPKRGNHTKLEDDEIREVQTLQLFPLCRDHCCTGTKKDRKVPIKTINTNISPKQFFEFLPLKN